MDFTQKKFQSLSQLLQHRHIAYLLKEIYILLINKNEQQASRLFSDYQKLIEWIGLEPLTELSYSTIADCYHYHLKNGKIDLQEHNFLPQVRRGDRLDQQAAPLPVSIYLDNLRSSHNVGSIIRTVEAFALGKIFFSSHTPNHTHQKVQKTAMGTTDWINGEICNDLSQLPRPLIALETVDQATDLYEFIFPSIFTLALGNEECGCSTEVLSKSDYILQIPLYGRKNSLNVANSFAIVASEISRQQRKRTF